MMTDDEIIAVVSAHKEGKKIQLKRRRGCDSLKDWGWVADITWDFSTHEYRVAPEPPKPREWRMPVSMLDTANMIKKVINNGESEILVREVIGASSGNPTVASDTASSIPKLKEWWLDFKNEGKNAEVHSYNYCGSCIHVQEIIEE